MCYTIREINLNTMETIVHNVTSEEKAWAAASYLWIVSIIVLALKKDNPFIRFHANQGFLLFVLGFASMLFPPLGIIILIAVVVGLIKALQGQQWPLPLVGQFATKMGNWIVGILKI